MQDREDQVGQHGRSQAPIRQELKAASGIGLRWSISKTKGPMIHRHRPSRPTTPIEGYATRIEWREKKTTG
jgi:hypothetical protein